MKKTDRKKFPQKVSDREQSKLDAGKQEKKIWFGLGMFGMVGWSVALPAVGATFLGVWMDSMQWSSYSWTLMLFMAGLCLGCWNAWYWMQKERREITGKKEKDKQ